MKGRRSKRTRLQRTGTPLWPATALLLGLAGTCHLVLRFGLAWYRPWLRACSVMTARPPDGLTHASCAPLPLDTARCAANLPWCAFCREATVIPFPRRAGGRSAPRVRRTGPSKHPSPSSARPPASHRPLSSRESD
jgi:hypothetical protein